MNKVELVGNLAKDPQLFQTQSGISKVSFTVAVNRKFKPKDQSAPTADFINCVAWREKAEFVERNFSKGKWIAVVGELRTRSYESPDGQKRYVTEVEAEECSFVGPRVDDQQNSGGYDGGGRPPQQSPQPQRRQQYSQQSPQAPPQPSYQGGGYGSEPIPDSFPNNFYDLGPESDEELPF